MNISNLRRAQLVMPFGVGAMSVLVDGTSVITAGLDHWYECDIDSDLDDGEYKEHDWRLEARLGVSEFRLPPDFRPSRGGEMQRNTNRTVPVLRFPRWCFCSFCKKLELSTLTMKQKVICPGETHSDKKYKPRMSQVPFVAICPHGHLDDFPFNNWAHHSNVPSCSGSLRLISTVGGLEGLLVKCDRCNASRSLRGITEAHYDANGNERTNLSYQMASPDEPYFCRGAQPWLGRMETFCGAPLRGALRGAGNVYFPKVESSIYLPMKYGAVSEELHELMRRPNVSVAINTVRNICGVNLTVEMLRNALPKELFEPITNEELMLGYQEFFGIGQSGTVAVGDGSNELLTGDEQWRYPEFKQIRETPKDIFLSASNPGIHSEVALHLERVRSVDVLRETRALRGFTRVRDDILKLSSGKSLLRRAALPPSEDWLPAYVVKGEGIYLELEPKKLTEWESRSEVQVRVDRINSNYGAIASKQGRQSRTLTSRFVMIHTLSHLLMNQLVNTCGYSSASLRERLYVSNSADREMGGVLIYTAAGDSEGTMGGLVRMSRQENLRSVFAAALSDSRWCSTDPVCMDAGEKGQGPDSCNLAACHGCALIPETSCEEFNRFLDRGLVIGTFEDPTLGFFSDLDFT